MGKAKTHWVNINNKSNISKKKKIGYFSLGWQPDTEEKTSSKSGMYRKRYDYPTVYHAWDMPD